MKRTRNLVFAGAGHAHLYPLARVEDFVREGIKVTVIAPGSFWYSGMGPGLLSGAYQGNDDQVDIEALVTRQGARFVRDEVKAIYASENVLSTCGGERIPYDALSLNIGSDIPTAPLIKDEAAAQDVIEVKPVRNFMTIRDRIVDAAFKGTYRILVAGGGAAGCEAAANALTLCREYGLKAEITVVEGSESLLPGFPPRASALMRQWFQQHGIAVRLETRVETFGAKTAELSNGGKIHYDLAISALGVQPPDLIRESVLRNNDEGALLVNRRLQSITHPNVFGGGDCIQSQTQPLPRVGVYAVRQGPVLHENLLAFLGEGRSLVDFKPQKKYLLILNLGDGTGLLARGGIVLRSRLAFRLKNRLDRAFIRTYQQAAER